MATITKRGESYLIRVSMGYDIYGKQIIKSKTFNPPDNLTETQIEKALQRETVLFEENCKNGMVLSSSTKLIDFVEIWIKDYAKNNLKTKTLSRYEDMLKRILPALGHLKIDKIKPQHLLAFYDNLRETGIRNDVKYTAKIDIFELINKQNHTKKEFLEATKVSQTTLNALKNGKNVSPETVDKICKAYNLKKEPYFEAIYKNSGNLSSKTIRHHHNLLSSIFRTAVEWQMIFANPCDRVKAPKVEYQEAKYLDEVQAGKLLLKLQSEDIQNQTIISLLLYTGMRRAELCGLEWTDVDFENKLITVQRNSLYTAEKGIFVDSTKTATSRRVIKISTSMMNVLKNFQEHQNCIKEQLGDVWKNTNRLFTAWDGGAIHPDVITAWFQRFVKKNDLPSISLHSLRHTNATLLIASGTNLQTVAKRLGHANPTTTSKIYSHAIQSADEKAADTLQDILKPQNPL